MEEAKSRKRKRSKHHSKSQSRPKKNKPLQSCDKSKPQNYAAQENAEHENPVLAAASSSSSASKRSKSASFLEKMRAKLSGGHFRMINEKLYTCTGEEAHNYFKEDPSLFDMYHAGYQEQMSHWPEQPINVIVNWLKGHSPALIVADFGCGDACLAKNVNNKVFSFDLVSNNPSVVACDMSNVYFLFKFPSMALCILDYNHAVE
uniref:Ribosomal RNA-processing protein 8 n=1 Tax=Rhizophora mucronata TaxID=61149 RepID=A0A2P2KFV4_RHIMU